MKFRVCRTSDACNRIRKLIRKASKDDNNNYFIEFKTLEEFMNWCVLIHEEVIVDFRNNAIETPTIEIYDGYRE